MKKQPLVSVVMPAYNREKILPKSINSVISQNYKNWELIVVDDRSSDKTKELIEKYMKKDDRIKYALNKHKKGPGGARNQGLDLAKGKYIAFLDSDDEWLKHHLRDSVKVLENEKVPACVSFWYDNKDGKLVKYNYDWIKRAVRVLKARIKGKLCFFGKNFCEYAISRPLYCTHINTLVFKKNLINDVGIFNEKLLATQDMEFVFRVLFNRNFCLVKDYHFIYNKGYDNISAFKDIQNKIKVSFHRKYYIKTLKIFKRIIRRSNAFKNKRECIRRLNKYIAALCFEVGNINWNNKKLKSLHYYLKSLFYYLISLYYCPRDIAFLIYFMDKNLRSAYWYINSEEEFRNNFGNKWLFKGNKK